MYKHKSLIAPRAINADPQVETAKCVRIFSQYKRDSAERKKKEKGKEEEEEEKREKRRKKEIERDKREDDRRDERSARGREKGQEGSRGTLCDTIMDMKFNTRVPAMLL